MNIRRAAHARNKEDNQDVDDNISFGIASIVLGILGILLVFIPNILCSAGIAAGIIGIILGVNALSTKGKIMAIIGIILSSIGILIGIANFVLSFRSPSGL